jgi:hypothetical protein
VKRLIDLLGQDLPDLHHLTLACLANCLEDRMFPFASIKSLLLIASTAETSLIFPELGGLPPVIKMLGVDDVRSKRNASLAIARAGKAGKFDYPWIQTVGILTAFLLRPESELHQRGRCFANFGDQLGAL